MGNIGDSISDSAPAVGTSGPGYATTINSLLTEFKTRLASLVPLSSLTANSTFNMNGQAMTNLAYALFTNTVVSPGASPANRILVYNGDFYFVGPSGAVKITNGAALNSASLGGITGDYTGAGPMEFRYDAANTRYDAFANQSTNTFAYVRARGFDIAASATSNNRARLLFGGGASVSYTFPAAAPGSNARLLMDSTGAILTTGTVAREINYDLKAVGRNIDIDGLLTASVIARVNVALPVGSVMTGWSLKADKTTSNANTLTARMFNIAAGGAGTGLGSAQTNSANNPGAITLSESSTSYTLATGETFRLEITPSAFSGGGSEWVYTLKINYNEPV